MNVHKIDFANIPQLSLRDKQYQQSPNPFEDFLAYLPIEASFDQAIRDRNRYPVNREVLAAVFTDQYQSLPNNDISLAQIDKLKSESTYTVVTAHQPVLFTGPLYYIYKILSTINLAEHLNSKYEAYHFVPTMVSGGEDHDFEEMNQCHLFGKSIKWERPAGGSVGRMDLKGLEMVINQLSDILSDKPSGQTIRQWVNDAYQSSTTYAEFNTRLVHAIFGKYGLIVLNPDDARLKKLFVPAMEAEILHQKSHRLVEDTQKLLDEKGFKSQAHAREINIFYLTEGGRDRIIKEGGIYKVHQTDITFTEEEIIYELRSHPDRFSPNVIMRPMYQETVLPNLAYIGGGGELAYWIERKSQFEAFNIFYPILLRRASLLIINGGQSKTMRKLNISIDDLFLTPDEIINAYLVDHAQVELTLEEETKIIEHVYRQIADRAKVLDPTLEKKILAEGTKQAKQVVQLESRLKRTVKAQQDTQVNKIRKLKDKLFPNLGLQERYDNYLQYYDMYGPDFLETLKNQIDPLDKSFIVIEY